MTYTTTQILRMPTNNNERDAAYKDLSVFDIKEVYDRAFEAMEGGKHTVRSKRLMGKAITMDVFYRRQLAQKLGHLYKTSGGMDDMHTDQAA